MRRLWVALAAFVLAVTGSLTLASPALAVPGSNCGIDTINFYNTSTDPAPLRCYPGFQARNQCISDIPDNLISYIGNFTDADWPVWNGGNANIGNHGGDNCTGGMAIVFAHTAGSMAGQWTNSIDATMRKAVNKTLGACPPGTVDAMTLAPVGYSDAC